MRRGAAAVLDAVIGDDARVTASRALLGTVEALAIAEQRDYDSMGLGDISDFASPELVAACLVADTHPSNVHSMVNAFDIEGEQVTACALALKSGEMRVVRINETLAMSVPRHYGDFMRSRDKSAWHQRMAVEVHRLINIPVARLIHKSDFPPVHEGPHNLVWAFDIKAKNAAKEGGSPLDALRPRVCVGRPVSGGTPAVNDPSKNSQPPST